MNLVERLLKGETGALARAMTLVENGGKEAREILKATFPHSGRALVIGVTGAPGSGKSTLVDQLAKHARRQQKTVGIVAVDPTSPFTGGAILADRLRMNTFHEDPDVFIRSMASRGQLGGLASATSNVVSLLDAAGKELIFVETVGVGQDEVEIVKLADVSVVVLVPGMGDDVQAFKAGIMEIADVFVINKSDHAYVDKMEKELQVALSMARRPDGWTPPIVRTIATQSEGIGELMSEIARFTEFFKSRKGSQDFKKIATESTIVNLLKELLLEKAVEQQGAWDKIRAASKLVCDRQMDPYTAAESIIQNLGQSDSESSADDGELAKRDK